MSPLLLGWKWIPWYKYVDSLSFVLFWDSDLCGKINQSVRERKTLTNSVNQIKSDIEKLKSSLHGIGNQEHWNIWIETFGKSICDRRNIPDHLKKVFLKSVLDCILVDYDWTEKVHRLNIHFKIPVPVSEKHPILIIIILSAIQFLIQILCLPKYLV